ncbi:NAD(P)-dependent alcohol dehydrogenase [Pantoea agglomerans]|uniref:NAD(P)-dependent alcohol dehydrogenase n=1 Tax=Enterobacter agglomerans TaxID=549 RepID=UPI003CEE2079
MKRIQYESYGGTSVMKLADYVPAEPASGEVQISVRAAAINPIDWKIRNGNLKVVTGRKFPRAMGVDFSGVVTATGSGVSRVRPGDAVFGLAKIKQCGAFAESVVTEENLIALKPGTLSFEEAACLGTPGVTAWNALIDRAKITQGQRIFINGCGGAVGMTALQIARVHGAVVTGSCSAEDAQKLRLAGAEMVYDYRRIDPRTLREKFDVVLDASAKMSVQEALKLLNPRGKYLDLNPGPAKFLRSIFTRQLKPIVCSPRAEILDSLASAAGSGEINIAVAKAVYLTEAIPLLDSLEKGLRIGGKAIIKMS